ncbi:hypothetical protein K7432_009914 [Basidiobolus ranarum]|uniref:Cyclin N-terminal domain-containing protein n=1 Tax=Basidiobolus ranarum TaxID=34480 RepID=A0ABR2VWC9_9FUNG
MVTSFNTIFIPATPRPCGSLQKQKTFLPLPNVSNSRQFLINYFPNLSTIRMSEFAAHVVTFLWSVPDSTLHILERIPMHSTSLLKDMFLKITLNLELSTITIVLALKYMYRLRTSLNASTLDPNHLTELFVSCVLLATKYHLDVNIRNSEWSGKVGITAKDLSGMERWLLRQLGYDLGISYEDFMTWINWLSCSWNQPSTDGRDHNIYLEKLRMFNLQITSQHLHRAA